MLEHRVWLVLQLGGLKHHVEKIAFVSEIVIGIGVLHSDPVPKSKSRNGRHFSNQAMNLFTPALNLKDILGVRIESRKCSQRCFKHAHRVRVVVEAIDYLLDALINKSVMRYVPGPFAQLSFVRKFAVKQQVGHLKITTLFGQLVDGITTIFKNTL